MKAAVRRRYNVARLDSLWELLRPESQKHNCCAPHLMLQPFCMRCVSRPSKLALRQEPCLSANTPLHRMTGCTPVGGSVTSTVAHICAPCTDMPGRASR